jgi:hypothetical protein
MRHRTMIVAVAAALFCASAPASAKILITIDKSAQQMTVAVDGVPRWTFPVSTGRLAYDTPSGRYTAFRMEKDHFSKEWDDAPMPHSIFFTKLGHAIHGSYETRRIGAPASHGCVRLSPANAAKLYALVEQQGVLNTTVVLTGDVRVALARRGAPVQTAARPREPIDLQPAATTGYAQPQDGYQQSQYGDAQRQPEYGYAQQQPQYGYAPQPQPFRPLPFFPFR